MIGKRWEECGDKEGGGCLPSAVRRRWSRGVRLLVVLVVLVLVLVLRRMGLGRLSRELR